MTAVNKNRGKHLTHRCFLNLSHHPCHQGSASQFHPHLDESVSTGRGSQYIFSIRTPDPIFMQVWEAPNHPLRQILLLAHFVDTKRTWIKWLVHRHTAWKGQSGLSSRPTARHLAPGHHILGYHSPRPTRTEASGFRRPPLCQGGGKPRHAEARPPPVQSAAGDGVAASDSESETKLGAGRAPRPGDADSPGPAPPPPPPRPNPRPRPTPRERARLRRRGTRATAPTHLRPP